MADHPPLSLDFVLAIAMIAIAALARGAHAQFTSNSTANATFSCSDAYTFTSRQMGANIQTVLATLLDQGPAAGGFKSMSSGNLGDTVYGLIQCRGDITAQECSSCARSAFQLLNSTCVRNSTKGGRVYLDHCFLRYEDHFFSSTLDIVSSIANCSTPSSSLAIFQPNSKTALEFLEIRVPQSARKYVAAVAGIESAAPAYALGQCVPDLSAADCVACLAAAENVIASTCRGGGGGVCYYASCTLFFQGSKFFQGIAENATLPSGSKGKKTLGLAIGIPIAGVAALLLLVLGYFILKRRKKLPKKQEPAREEFDELQLTLHRGPVTFSYDLLRRATEDFSDDKKLGEGGFGAVYKGTFGDGTEIAIKKLSVSSKQGEQQFLNEVKVIGSVQHRNLVRLLGCCVEGSERLLVYEFLKNNSLEKALLDDMLSEEETPRLSLTTRYNILLGTARGLTYLHEDSQIRIVHRDIKPSNILLDETFEAKISDFGLARLYEEDEATEIITTKVAGTYGYMAPEYAFHGHLSEKADVFTFGVVVLETLAGRKNRDVTLPGPEQYLLEWAWQLHSDGLLANLLDPKLVRSSSNEQERTLVQAIHIALMCTQASPQDRPSMSHVVAMLSGHSNVNVPLSATFDIQAMNPRFYSSSSNSAASDPKNRRSKTFSTPPEPR
ncbi:cysteine-rich receptor-like protein kinase 15 [Selaginella moellendorffii]|uniref:cysteine-rich receptor-like protein kinase 15 n=1 Tax=Selaginella moellendorffii TaxID=88036 RepID=UPI000D1CEA97|nr:cysteine-rich receptor-like protein kinase 15 [Selaginella moellendorffii]|eukprot:XP_024517325.1 cysteine-rich receptor-like protein kinase 15 [Selaginella moellendorffii]